MPLIHTCYRILEIDRSVAFYEALGFREVARMPIRDEAINVFMNMPGDGDSPRLELTYNVGRTEPYEIGTGYGHIAIAESIATAATIYRVHTDGRAAIGMGTDTRLLRPISQGSIHARARTLHTGRTTWLWDADFHDDADRPCATSRVTAYDPAPR